MQLKPLLILLFLNITIAHAQQLHLTGSVIDGSSNKPIPNATISLINKNLFYPADDAGKFDVSNNSLATTDSVGFSCIGYQSKKIAIKEIQADDVIKLMPLVTVLSEVKIGFKPPQLVKVGSTKNSAFGTASILPNMLAAMFMPGSAKIGGNIKTVGFHLTNGNFFDPAKGDVTAPFRIRLFEADANGAPGKELTKEIIIVSAKKKGWFDVDLSDYKIQNPDNGFLVAFCLLNNDYYKDENAKKNHSSYGTSSAYIQTPRLEFTNNEFKDALSYGGYAHADNVSWHKDDHFKHNYLMRAVVAVD